jgi:hypothetical protein
VCLTVSNQVSIRPPVEEVEIIPLLKIVLCILFDFLKLKMVSEIDVLIFLI